MPLILDGRKVRDEIRAQLKEYFADFARKNGFAPALAIIQIGDNPASNAYIRQKVIFGESAGAQVIHKKLPESVIEKEVENCIKELSKNKNVFGIIVQLPLPAHLNRERILNLVPVAKDVDGLAVENKFVPATGRGVFELLSYYNISVKNKKVAVFGRSRIAGGPIAKFLSQKGALVSVINSQTAVEEAKKISQASDVVVAAIGKPKHIGAEFFRNDKTQIVVDVGINKNAEGKLVGDVDFENVAPMVFAISTVPGGVGPMTVTALFENLKDASIGA
jgi:methylenetetrahydrofolate dehydrogenase (NADP+)/methenyltetrahydrofolate cyclohydrolase